MPGTSIKPHSKHRIFSPYRASAHSHMSKILLVYIFHVTQYHSGLKRRPHRNTTQHNRGVKMDYLAITNMLCMHGFSVYFEVDLQDKYGLKILQSKPIWLNDNYLYYDYEIENKDKSYIIDVYKPRESIYFHPDPEWLSEYDNISHKAECVEIYRLKDWIKERGYMPMVLLYELA
eukprot:1001910_1